MHAGPPGSEFPSLLARKIGTKDLCQSVSDGTAPSSELGSLAIPAIMVRVFGSIKGNLSRSFSSGLTSDQRTRRTPYYFEKPSINDAEFV